MQIKRTPTIDQFMKRCLNNLNNETKNEFLGLNIEALDHDRLKRSMAKAGFQEFQGPKVQWPSLYLNTQEYIKNPYTAHIRFDDLSQTAFKYTQETIYPHELFSVSSIVDDQNRELNDWMMLRAMDEAYQATFLWQDDEVWMLDAPSEMNTILPYAQKAEGKVLTFGLGIGFYVFMALLNENVESVTIVERSSEVIHLFNSVLRPQFPSDKAIHIIQGDAFDYFNEDTLSQYDSVFVDIWQSNEDGLELIEKLLEQYLPPFNKVDFWIESSCMEIMHALVYMVIKGMIENKAYNNKDPMFNRIVRKIKHYLKQIDEEVNDVNRLKALMYDPKTLRMILSIKQEDFNIHNS
jgi:hypothetical protein